MDGRRVAIHAINCIEVVLTRVTRNGPSSSIFCKRGNHFDGKAFRCYQIVTESVTRNRKTSNVQ